MFLQNHVNTRCGLVCLSLSGNAAFGGEGLSSLCIGLADNKSIKTIRLADCGLGTSNIDQKGLADFARVVSSHPQIIAIDLSRNTIRTVGGNLLLSGMGNRPQLTELLVEPNGMQEDVFKALFRSSATSKESKKNKKKTKKKK